MEQIISQSIYRDADYLSESWDGGKAQELFVYPRDSSYNEKNFIFRLSQATIEKEETQFTSLAEYDRTIMVLEGEVILSFEGTRLSRLSQWEQDQFDGKETIKSFGKIKDYNLMVLKGNRGLLEAINLTKERQEVSMPKDFTTSKFDGLYMGLYCAEGFLLVTTGKDVLKISPGEQLILEINLGDLPSIGVMGEGKAIKSLVAYFDQPNFEEIPRVKSITVEDIKAAFYIAYTNFRGAQHIFKSKRHLWYDPPLQKAINRIERFYLPLLICILGLLFVIYGGMKMGTFEDLWKWVVIWMVLDLLFITPGLFLLTLPRPIRKHMKLLRELTPYEQRLWEKEKNINVKLEKILKKYAISGRNFGDEHQGKSYKSFKE